MLAPILLALINGRPWSPLSMGFVYLIARYSFPVAARWLS
jgi:hypothetical protein